MFVTVTEKWVWQQGGSVKCVFVTVTEKWVWQQGWKCKVCVCNSDREVGVSAGRKCNV